MSAAALDEIIENLSLFENWEERYRYIIDMGDRLPPMDDALKTDDKLVPGCTSRVWLDAHIRDGTVHFSVDSDSKIVKGLLYILHQTYNNMSINEIPLLDIQSAFTRMGLNEHLSPNRRNGFFAVAGQIRSIATKT